jgi:hypothetical protein
MVAAPHPLLLKAHIEAAKEALQAGPYKTLDDAAEAVAKAVIEASQKPRWVVIKDTGTTPTAYGPYASAASARKAIDSGLMLGGRAMLFAMQPVPRAIKADRTTQPNTTKQRKTK